MDTSDQWGLDYYGPRLKDYFLTIECSIPPACQPWFMGEEFHNINREPTFVLTHRAGEVDKEIEKYKSPWKEGWKIIAPQVEIYVEGKDCHDAELALRRKWEDLVGKLAWDHGASGIIVHYRLRRSFICSPKPPNFDNTLAYMDVAIVGLA